ncbi:hypothetical protein ACK8HX_02370 [Oryzobacter sp. R7]|uniref:hypothetical protein n=1 Tax=Oryzobacter faecalis TaxID=3388656 RepID=UPI00398C9D73
MSADDEGGAVLLDPEALAVHGIEGPAARSDLPRRGLKTPPRPEVVNLLERLIKRLELALARGRQLAGAIDQAP